MPELPEVETIKRGLENKIVGKKIRDIIVGNFKIIKSLSKSIFINELKNKVIKKICRRGKYIIIDLYPKKNLVIHLGMTGLLIYPYVENCDEIISGKIKPKHNHVIFNFEDNTKLVFNDVRRFGKVYLVSDMREVESINKLGLEPLEECFSVEAFSHILEKKKKNKIKSLLMKQDIIAGLGNIYVNEILYRANIHPLRQISSLTKEESKKLYLEIKSVLTEAVKFGGSTVADEAYRDTNGEKGKFAKKLQIYARKGELCKKCGNTIEVIKIEGRSTFFCLHCQKL